MIPAAFDYVRATDADSAVAALAEHGDDAKLLAGGHSLLPMMKLRLAVPSVLVDIGGLRDLSYTRVEGDEVAIGALTRHETLARSAELRREAPLLPHVARLVGDRQVRHRGTIGGSLVHSDPAADLPTAVRALDAVLVVQGPDGRRRIDAADFFTSYFETALQPDEMLVEIRIPRGDGAGWAYEKFVRRANDWAIVAVAVAGNRVALANMGSVPLRAGATEEALASGASVAEAADLAAEGTEPVADMHADAEYRRHLARLLTRRALTTAAGIA
ncbi:MAG TPA: xanthine dehydrogenase family protein subunit M [Jatrophihabitans sp.]|uniref:FAD binding domain-containing protein n=1 Tax=Jatrophihabitans sp. TaxID=1932789 RepID=UPI002DFE5172|nr:xanthine dehydrogenase family protein subunit M [Jatrophihabitans sp.]